MRHAAFSLSCLLLAALTSAPALAQGPTLDALWPNVDGLTWTYDVHYESYDDNPMTVDGQVRLGLDGTTVAAGGVQAQYLRQQWIGATPPGFAAFASPVATDPFLRSLAIARPDLRAAVARLVDDSPCPQYAPTPSYSLLLDGEFAYRQTADEIAAWRCNLATTRAWLWLVSDLSIGSSFTLQLIPDLASDVLLHGTVGAVESASVPAGTYADCVRVDYVVEYGTNQCVDSDGNVTGTSRFETQGWVRYAPGVGPVESRESLVLVTGTGTCGAGPAIRNLTTQRLSSAPVPTVTTSWGRLKLVHR